MARNLNLKSLGIIPLITLTNTQFEFWTNELKERTKKKVSAGHTINYWYIMTYLATKDGYEDDKKSCYLSIPSLKEETTRKYVTNLEKMAFVATYSTGEKRNLQLTKIGQEAVLATLKKWIEEFGKIQGKYFSKDLPNASKGEAAGKKIHKRRKNPL